MFLLNEHCITPSTSLQAISSRVPYKHKSLSTLSKDLLKARHAPNPGLLHFLSLRLEEHVLSSVSFLSFPHQRTPRVFFLIIPVYLYVTWQTLFFTLSRISPVPPPGLENLADVLRLKAWISWVGVVVLLILTFDPGVPPTEWQHHWHVPPSPVSAVLGTEPWGTLSSSLIL